MPAIPWTSFIEIEPQREYLVLASRLPLRSYWQIPRFLRLTLAVRHQLAESEGLVGYSLLAQVTKKTFWTLSAWVEADDLQSFVRALPHADVMLELRPHMGPTAFTTWTAPGDAFPVSWQEATARLMGTAEAQAAAP
jgi:hypothetical protein